MKFAKLRKSLAVTLAAAMCLTAATTAMASAEGNKPSGSPPAGAVNGAPPSGGGAPGGGADTMTYDYGGELSGVLTADGTDKTSDGETYSTDTADQNAALAENGGTLTATNGSFAKSGDDANGDNCNFYGINSIVLAVGDGTAAYISGSGLTADSEGSNGIFATDDAAVYANSDTITTTASNSRGLDATYGGTIIANAMDISTSGDHCAAIATDRGGGSISVTNSSLKTAGSGSPLLYSTGDIEVDNATGTSTGSQIAGMEGLNTILIYNSSLESTVAKASASDPIADGIIMYQSTSGDAEAATGETAVFQAVDSTLKSAIESGAMFYLTNTRANILLSGTTLDFDSDKANLLTVQGNNSNNWGTAGSNGAAVTFTALGETLGGNIDVDTISSLNLYLLDGTVYTGAIAISQNAVNTSASDSPVTVNIGGDSKWIVTANSTVTNLNAADGAAIVDAEGKTVTIVANGKTVVSGNSAYTVTVVGGYTNTVTVGDANAVSTEYIDRTQFDKYYAVETAFSSNTAAAAVPDSEEAAADTGDNTQNSRRFVYAAIAAAVLGAAGIYVYKRSRGDEDNED